MGDKEAVHARRIAVHAPPQGGRLLAGIWDIARLPFVRDPVTHLGYPSYFLVLLGTWKVLGAAALLVPRRALLKEWAYAGAFFTYTGAIVSHLTTGYALGEVGVLAVLTDPPAAACPPRRWPLRSAAPLASRTPSRWPGTGPRVQARPPRAQLRRGRSSERRWPAR